MNRKEFLKVGLGALTMACLPVKGESKYQVKGKTWHEVHLDVIDEITKEMNQYWSTHTEGTLVDRRVGLYNHMQNRFKTYYSSLFDNGIVRWLGVQPITEVSGFVQY